MWPYMAVCAVLVGVVGCNAPTDSTALAPIVGSWEGTPVVRNDIADTKRQLFRWTAGAVYKSGAPQTGIVVVLVSGPSNLITIHTPDVDIYDKLLTKIESVPLLPDSVHEWRFADFERRHGDRVETVERIYWAFSADGDWHSPFPPRGYYRNIDTLYKLYFVTDPSMPQETVSAFAEQFLPMVNRQLFR